MTLPQQEDPIQRGGPTARLEQAKREIDEQYPYMQTGMVTLRRALIGERARARLKTASTGFTTTFTEKVACIGTLNRG